MIGFALFAIGGAFRIYIQMHARGLAGFTARNVVASYRKLVRDGRAPLWPLLASYVFIFMGILVVFGSILVGKR